MDYTFETNPFSNMRTLSFKIENIPGVIHYNDITQKITIHINGVTVDIDNISGKFTNDDISQITRSMFNVAKLIDTMIKSKVVITFETLPKAIEDSGGNIKCQSVTKKGSQCRNKAMKNKNFCGLHLK